MEVVSFRVGVAARPCGERLTMVPRKRSMLSSSKRARVMDEKKSMPSKSESISIEVCVDEESVRLARSQAVRRRRMARALLVMSFLCCQREGG